MLHIDVYDARRSSRPAGLGMPHMVLLDAHLALAQHPCHLPASMEFLKGILFSFLAVDRVFSREFSTCPLTLFIESLHLTLVDACRGYLYIKN